MKLKSTMPTGRWTATLDLYSSHSGRGCADVSDVSDIITIQRNIHSGQLGRTA